MYDCKLFLIIFVTLLNCGNHLFGQQQYEIPHKRFEYKYSFKGPYLAQKDGTVPFWEYEGNAIASEEMVRITPSLRSKKGAIWTKLKTNFEWWEVEFVFRVSGRGRLGADGIAFWYTDNRMPEGPVYGTSDQWKGLGVFFDSFDNDNKGNNPYIMAMINDGTKSYDHETDGSNQQIGGCLRDFRNKPFPVRAKIEYYKNVLSISFHSGSSNNDDEYELCLRAENVFLPQFGHFGISAATGGLADDHDALKFLTYSLHVPGVHPQTGGIAESEKEKFAREYEQYKEKLDRQKEEYLKAHPEEAKKIERETQPDDEVDFGTRELQQIFNGQSQMFEALRHLHRKLDEVIGRQERALSLLSSVQSQGGGGVPQGQVPQQQQYAGAQLPIQRHEVEALIGNQKEVVQNSRELKNLLAQQQNAQQPQGNAQQQIQFSQQLLTEIRDGINIVKREIGNVGARMGAVPAGVNACPPSPSCVSNTYFFLFLFIHLLVLLGYSIYKSNKEAQAKKFY